DSVTSASPGWKTWHWTTRYPINLYDVTVNIGDYIPVHREVTGIAPTPVPLVFYALREDTAGAEGLLDQAETMLRFYSRHFGDYPFYKEKFGLAESPFWGMEHQTLNAYGNHYKNTPLGYDFLMLHEMGHEWFGNSMTVHDWADFWLHEGTDIYAEAMFIRDQYGEEEYHWFFNQTVRPRIQNKQPIVAHRNATSAESYTIDVYYKAAFVLYMLGQMIGSENVERVLYNLVTDSLHTGVNGVSTNDFLNAIQSQTERPLDSFFQAYFFSARLPELKVNIRYQRSKVTLTLSLDSPGLSLPVPLAIVSGSDTSRTVLWVTDQEQSAIFTNCTKIIVDPEQRLLVDIHRGWLRRILDRFRH
ncbi:MAG: M1 family metallopeptidase, partial [FCB group bacterium]|nr:M1 family metallopeptidase [FCB group bacterium]